MMKKKENNKKTLSNTNRKEVWDYDQDKKNTYISNNDQKKKTKKILTIRRR